MTDQPDIQAPPGAPYRPRENLADLPDGPLGYDSPRNEDDWRAAEELVAGDGTPLRGTAEVFGVAASGAEVRRAPDGRTLVEWGGETDPDMVWDSQESLELFGENWYLDEAGYLWPQSALVTASAARLLTHGERERAREAKRRLGMPGYSELLEFWARNGGRLLPIPDDDMEKTVG